MSGRPRLPSGEGPVANFSRPVCELSEKARGPNFWLQIWIPDVQFLPIVGSIQVPQSATPSQIVRGKTLRQVNLSRGSASNAATAALRWPYTRAGRSIGSIITRVQQSPISADLESALSSTMQTAILAAFEYR